MLYIYMLLLSYLLLGILLLFKINCIHLHFSKQQKIRDQEN